MTKSELDKAFKKAQLDLLLLEIEERRFRLAQEMKKSPISIFDDITKFPKTFTPKPHQPTYTPQPPAWQNPYQIPTPFTSDSRIYLGDGQSVINCASKGSME